MYFQHAQEIWNDFPQLSAGALFIEKLHTDVDMNTDLERFYTKTRERLQSSSEGEMPEVVAWRTVFSAMGLKPTKYRCAVESLLRRFRKEGTLPRFHPLVDLCNALSMAFAIPIAVYDVSSVQDFIEVRYADGSEQYLDFSGEVESPPEGEVVFADGQGHAHSRRWCFRQSKNSVMKPENSAALIVAEAHHDSAGQDIGVLMENLTEALTRLWSAPKDSKLLFVDNPRFKFQ